MTNDQMIDLWEAIDGRISELMEGQEPLPESEIPFDAASDEPMEDQKYNNCRINYNSTHFLILIDPG